eukprot:2163112-Rhodomonas_salina.1
MQGPAAARRDVRCHQSCSVWEELVTDAAGRGRVMSDEIDEAPLGGGKQRKQRPRRGARSAQLRTCAPCLRRLCVCVDVWKKRQVWRTSVLDAAVWR